MRLAFIGDIVGRPGRDIIKSNLKILRQKFEIDFVIANCENASHGFGITIKNYNELRSYGIDVCTSGNHIWDKKKDILNLFQNDKDILRPDNYPKGVIGSGVKIYNIQDSRLAVVNLMGLFAMPQVENPFNWAVGLIEDLKERGIINIFIDFHAESTAEKMILFELLQGKVSAICGTHTHVSTDDMQIRNGTFYITDIGLTGCRDGIIGMDTKNPIIKATTGLSEHFDIPKRCKKILQLVIIDIDQCTGKTIDTFKVQIYDNIENSIVSHICKFGYN